jgi:hypothetical protein
VASLLLDTRREIVLGWGAAFRAESSWEMGQGHSRAGS